jgi:RNA methyltransferase, TrmH family
MLSKNEIKHIRSLENKKFRDEFSEFLVEGEKMVTELLLQYNNPLIKKRFVVKQIYALSTFVEELDVDFNRVTTITPLELERLSLLNTPNKVVALLGRNKDFDEKINVADELVLAVDNVQDPGNMGTIIRTADWFGVRNIVCNEHCVDVFNPKVIQATMGSFLRVNVHCLNLKTFLQQNYTSVPVYGALLNGESIYKKEIRSNGIIVVGNESKGISDELLPMITNKLFLPRPNHIDTYCESLNVSVATAIILSEFRRRDI